MNKRVAFLGPSGTFSEEAAKRHDQLATLQPFPTIQGVALAVTSGITDEGIIPIENSLEGSVNDTLDILIQQPKLFIRQELVIDIVHCLLVIPGTTVSDIKLIYSHPQAIAQCRGFIERCFPNAQMIASLSTSAAVLDMKQSESPAAAIAPNRSASLHQVQILAEGIQDIDTNVTRFVVLSTSDNAVTGNDKTSLCFSFNQDKPGLLHEVMGEFVQRNINMAKVESRPSKQFLGDYIFLIDIEGHRTDPIIKDALSQLDKKTSMLRVFGSYPKWK